MKGVAEITVRGKDGKVKLKRREHNMITTAHVDKIKQALANQNYSRTAIATAAYDFQGIWLHSKQLESLVDMQPVVLCGGTAQRQSSSSTDYSAAVGATAESGEIATTWAWYLDKSVTINAISLHSGFFIGGSSRYYNELPIITRWGNSGFSAVRSSNALYRLALEVSRNFSALRDVATQKNAFNGKAPVRLPLFSNDEYLPSYLRTGELFSERNNIGGATVFDYFFIVTAAGDGKRKFMMSQFEGLSAQTEYYVRVMPTQSADWLFVYKSTTEVAVYKIPRESTQETIALEATISGTGLSSGSTLILSNCAIFNATSQAKTMFCANSDGTFSVVSGVQVVNGTLSDSYCLSSLVRSSQNNAPTCDLIKQDTATPDVDEQFYLSVSPSPAVHNTILNLSSPIAAEPGDTLTITYKITVDDIPAAPQPAPDPEPTSFATDSWATIAAASADGTAKTKYRVGDEKTVQLTTGETIVLQIWGFDHDDLADDSGKAGITLGMKGLLSSLYPRGTGDWSNCTLRTAVLPTILGTLPEELQSVIKEVSKISGISGGGSQTTTDKLFAFSESEVLGDDGEGAWYEIFQKPTRNSRTDNAFLVKANDAAASWWLRGRSSSGQYNYITASGALTSSSGATSNYGVCFGLCV